MNMLEDGPYQPNGFVRIPMTPGTFSSGSAVINTTGILLYLRVQLVAFREIPFPASQACRQSRRIIEGRTSLVRNFSKAWAPWIAVSTGLILPFRGIPSGVQDDFVIFDHKNLEIVIQTLPLLPDW